MMSDEYYGIRGSFWGEFIGQAVNGFSHQLFFYKSADLKYSSFIIHHLETIAS